MHVGYLDRPDAFTAYLVEILRAWGLRTLRPADLARLDPAEMPVLLVPAGEADAGALLAYADAGGTLICLAPDGALAAAAGLHPRGEKQLPALLRMSLMQPSGLAGELLPIVGRAVDYAHDERARVLGHLCYPDRPDGESAGVVTTPVGQGRLITLAFDLPRGVWLLRQGDPAQAEVLPAGDPCMRPSHLACRLPDHDAGWVPFADLLGLLLLDLIRQACPAPLPLLAHLPGEAPAVLLYSGDEDDADPAATREECDWLAERGARMDLNLIPDTSPTSPELPDYLKHHDLGPHPNLRPFDGQPREVRLREFARQLARFKDTWNPAPLALRNHCTAWVGFTDIVEEMARAGLRMNTDYTSGQYLQGRHYAPYATFGGALPVRFSRPDGTLIDVYQLHTHIMDDVWFAPDEGIYRASDYSYRIGPEAFDVIAGRIFDDLAARLHTPLTVCIHPSNWVCFSRPHGQALVTHAQARNIPVWSVTQWCRFWDARDTWALDDVQWDGRTLTVHPTGKHAHADLRLALPVQCGALRLRHTSHPATCVTRYRQEWALLPVTGEKVTAEYYEANE